MNNVNHIGGTSSRQSNTWSGIDYISVILESCGVHVGMLRYKVRVLMVEQ